MILYNSMHGVSRSTMITASYIMRAHDWPLFDAMDYVKSRRKRAKPSQAFYTQLEIFSYYNRSYTHDELLRYTPNWPTKALVRHWSRDHDGDGVHATELQQPAHIRYDAWARFVDTVVHHYLLFFNTYLRFYVKNRN